MNHKNEEQGQDQIELVEHVIELNRTSKKTKGGNRFRFAALMVVGDTQGKVGIGIGKAKDVSAAIRKGVRRARRNMIEINLVGEQKTIAHDIRVKFKAARVLLKPAPAGTGVIAGGAIRTIAEAAGIKNIVGKVMGTDNRKSNIVATMQALEKLNTAKKRKTSLRKDA